MAVISGAQTWNEIENYGAAKEKFLREFLELPHSFPSHDTFNRVFSAIDRQQSEACFIEYKNSDEVTETAVRYYISDREATTKYFQKAIHSHWSIENKLHWTLDVAFGEEASKNVKVMQHRTLQR